MTRGDREEKRLTYTQKDLLGWRGVWTPVHASRTGGGRSAGSENGAGWMLPRTTEPSGEAGTKGYYRGSSDVWKDKPLPL